jgi:tRNA threonylcarbamoyladenosine biosynthesis protein TsaE
MKTIARNLEETKKTAKDFILSLAPLADKAVVVGLYGDLGAGKTSFTQGVAETFGISENVVSPTFVIEKIYELKNHPSTSSGRGKFSRLIHIDAYRLDKSEELLYLGWKQIISNPENLVLIEWPERVGGIMPDHIKIKLSHTPENFREIEIT